MWRAAYTVGLLLADNTSYDVILGTRTANMQHLSRASWHRHSHTVSLSPQTSKLNYQNKKCITVVMYRATKIILYMTLIRPVVSYGAEAWALTKKEEQALLIFERKIFRRI